MPGRPGPWARFTYWRVGETYDVGKGIRDIIGLVGSGVLFRDRAGRG